ncbi:hypothetical protein [Methylobacterium gnaphalii]|uniref:Uncharacterized protein n=1 Tax=Methylobacterium gnaphalii TaxID=1010610 RepID=A0A512JR15_9HYPH|nr:hypothetical protein [Methylobacterium gnaphalii]GEP12408.1 hypothetical protein MGN01_42530 [Methylobacterium gnaphalii]GJD71190.1 hypothetical protein MMMDOFMJ_4144 [Methylobacterium gnaphalii]GLS51572.1 hypothetical protein GCM10007885_44300 [Methylobacterium gnaphalii]
MNAHPIDVIARPVGDDGSWWLTDRSGRSLSAVKKVPGSPEVRVFPNRDSGLDGIHGNHPSLDGALRAIAEGGGQPDRAGD